MIYQDNFIVASRCVVVPNDKYELLRDIVHFVSQRPSGVRLYGIADVLNTCYFKKAQPLCLYDVVYEPGYWEEGSLDVRLKYDLPFKSEAAMCDRLLTELYDTLERISYDSFNDVKKGLLGYLSNLYAMLTSYGADKISEKVLDSIFSEYKLESIDIRYIYKLAYNHTINIIKESFKKERDFCNDFIDSLKVEFALEELDLRKLAYNRVKK